MRMFFYMRGDGIQWDRLGYDGILVNNFFEEQEKDGRDAKDINRSQIRWPFLL